MGGAGLSRDALIYQGQYLVKKQNKTKKQKKMKRCQNRKDRLNLLSYLFILASLIPWQMLDVNKLN